MANYNLTNLTDANSVIEYAQATNALTGDVFFIIITVFIYIIAFTAMKNFDTKTAFMSSSFIVSVLSALLWSVGLLSETTLITYFSLLIVSVFLKLITD